MYVLSEWKRISTCFLLLFVFICISIEDLFIKKGSVAPPSTSINRFNAATCVCQVLGFQPISRGLFAFNDIRWEVVVRFINVGCLIYHYCLNILLISCWATLIIWSKQLSDHISTTQLIMSHAVKHKPNNETICELTYAQLTKIWFIPHKIK